MEDRIQEIQFRIKEAESNSNKDLVVFLQNCLDNLITIEKFA